MISLHSGMLGADDSSCGMLKSVQSLTLMCGVCVCVCVCVFVPAYKPRIYPWLNTDEARIFDKAGTSHFVFSLD